MTRFSFSGLAATAAIAILLSTPGHAQPPRQQPAAPAGGGGYELALYGNQHAELGGELRVSGVAYQVRGLSTLDPFGGGEVWARLTRHQPHPLPREVVREVTVRADAQGRFDVVLPVPEDAHVDPRLEIDVRRAGAAAGRHWEYGIALTSPLRLDLLTDRRLYEPGEPMRVWLRLVRARTDAPVGDRPVRLRIQDQSGRPILERVVRTGASGAATLSHELGASAEHGQYTVTGEVIEGVTSASATRYPQVGRRTVERLLVTTELSRPLVAPAAPLSGRVIVRTPSGAPVQGARVEIRTQARGEPIVAFTNAEGIATFTAQAPAFLSGDVASQNVDVRVSHPAHGALHDRATYLLSRVQWVVSAVASNGGLVPELDGYAYLSVADPRGTPAPAGTEVVASGLPVRDGRQAVVTDAHGMAIVPMRLPAGAAAPIRTTDAGCGGQVATIFDVGVGAGFSARVCVNAATEAQVVLQVRDPVVGPGQEVAFEVQRRPDVRGQAVLAEAIVAGRAVAWTWLQPAESRGVLTLPRDVAGVIDLRARAAAPANARAPFDQDGAVSVGMGALDAVLVRPPDAFALEIEPAQEVWRVRERARIGIRTRPAPANGWVALLARDLAAHGGEEDWSLRWLATTLANEAMQPGGEEGHPLLRAALAAGLSPDTEPVRPTPLDPPPWQEDHRRYQRYGDGSSMHRGQLRDPIAIREELHRRGLGAMMMWLEQVVASLDTTDRAAQGLVRRAGNRATGFDPGVIATLVAQQRISAEAVKTLGGEQLTVAMLTEADPAFTFDNVARRIARTRLMTLLAALARFANPDDPNAARASAGEPPERWLSRVVQLGLVPATMLVDPWGNPYQFRRVGAERAAIVVSERAPDYELASAGPDGRIGSGDDIRDPFARILPEARPYAVASGEDNLMKQLSALAPGPRVLMAMAQAYASVGREAREEAQRQVVTATASEATAQMAPPPATAAPMPQPAPGMMDMAMGGAGGGGGTYAADSAGAETAEEEASERPAQRGRRSAASNREQGGEDLDGDSDDEGERQESAQQGQQQRTPGGSRLAVAGELVRERFPATLHFVGEVAIDAAGTAIVEVPLADALTTYRLEAIGWSSSGWTVSARGHVRVDQDAMVDAPVPPFGTTGDVVRIPVRIANRTAQPLAARVEVAAEGGLRITGTEPRAVEVPPNDAIEVLTEVRLGDPAEGFLVIRAVRAGDGSPLDAVRRPMAVLPDARLVRETFQLLVETGTDVTVEVPAEATPRGAGELRVAVGSAIFGDASQWGREDPIWGSWTLAASGERVPDELRAWSRGTLAAGGEAEEIYGDPHTLAIAVATSWNDRAVRDADVRRGLRAVSRVLEGNEGDEPVPMPGPSAARAIRDPGRIEMLSRVLLALSPAVGARGRTMARGDLDRLVTRLRSEVGSGAVAISDAPVLWATAAAALATTRKGRADARAEELLRRADRGVITVGDEAWLENESEAGRAWARVEPTSMLAIARAAMGQRQDAMPLVRSLAGLARGSARWGGQVRALASVAVSSLSRGRARADARVTMDGRALQVRNESGVAVAVLGRIGQPGTHTIQVRVAEGQVALAWVDARWGMPWSTPPERAALIDLAIEGPVGARDTRAGMQLIVRNRGARLLTAPIVEIDMPAGTELDVSATSQLGAWTAAPPAVEGRVLRLRLRPLAPGARLVLPLPVRWSLGGTLRGLGASAWDDATAPSLRVRPTAVLPSRALDIPDRGAEPATPEAEVPEVPRPPEPPPPIDIMRAFEGDRPAGGRRAR